ncbi:MAG TPA: hypothetical protein VHE13_00855 [Opitutus sp.]|nr:hypothetical protein [Opitutus sp.]
MHVETTELTYSHLDLGHLNEFGLLCLFGSLHSKALVHGLDGTVDDIRDQHGRKLYPAYFHTHLRVPAAWPLSRFGPWRQVRAGVEVRRFGKCYLDSSYVIKPESEAAPAADDFGAGVFPTMHANNLFIVDVSEDASVARQLAVPRPGSVAPLEAVAEKPAAIQAAKDVARDRRTGRWPELPVVATESIVHVVAPGRDVAPGHAMIFARFSQVMDCAEHVLLTEQLELPAGPGERSEYVLREREIFYLNNAYAGDTIDIAVKAGVSDTGEGAAGRQMLETEFQLFRRSNLDLLAVGRAKKEAAGDEARHVLDRLQAIAEAGRAAAV